MFMMTNPILFPHKSTINVDFDLSLVYDNHAMPHQSYSVVVSTIVPKKHTYIRGTLQDSEYFGLVYIIWHDTMTWKKNAKLAKRSLFYI